MGLGGGEKFLVGGWWKGGFDVMVSVQMGMGMGMGMGIIITQRRSHRPLDGKRNDDIRVPGKGVGLSISRGFKGWLCFAYA